MANSTSLEPQSAIDHHTSHHSRHSKRASDPFLELPDPDSDASSTNASAEGVASQSHSKSAFTDLLLTPILMISFLLSLDFVDRNNQAWRASQRYTSSRSFWSFFNSPQPYQDPRETTWKHSNVPGGQTGALPGSVPGSSRKATRPQRTTRKIAKLEISDALEMRGTMIAAMCIWAVVCLTASLWTLKKFYMWLA